MLTVDIVFTLFSADRIDELKEQDVCGLKHIWSAFSSLSETVKGSRSTCDKLCDF